MPQLVPLKGKQNVQTAHCAVCTVNNITSLMILIIIPFVNMNTSTFQQTSLFLIFSLGRTPQNASFMLT